MPYFLQLCLRRLIPILAVLAVWSLIAWGVHAFRGVDFPTARQTGERLWALLNSAPLAGSTLWLHIQESLQRWLAGFSIAAVSGVSFGLLAGGVPWFATITTGIPQVLLMIPGLAWIPVAILLFGIGEPATVFMIAVASFAPIAISVAHGIRGVDVYLIRAAQMMGAGHWTLFFQVLLPAALPSIISGLRIGLGTGWRVLVAAEMVVGTGTGLGYSIIQARWSLDYPAAFACIGVICAIGLVAERLVLYPLEQKTTARWTATLERS
ncbi:ABC transporter permease [Desulfobulbus oligotrophicus]|uniref:ABC transporter permease n=1 Tax=Desulfobulbus oligotrophicus TaxID=1909699 RepID=A0A7T5VB95_9BACT|nr:ABC transporter permease [Desulfobulbus oligotrophicus]QQG64693.1 ABC transporter permease [Desulfobulbus oligotrophicus]